MASGRRWDDSRNAAEKEEDWDRDIAREGGPPVSYLQHLKENPNPKVIRQCPAAYKGAQRKRWYAESRVYVAACEEADRLGLPRPPAPKTPPKGPVNPEKPAVRLPGVEIPPSFSRNPGAVPKEDWELWPEVNAMTIKPATGGSQAESGGRGSSVLTGSQAPSPMPRQGGTHPGPTPGTRPAATSRPAASTPPPAAQPAADRRP